MESTALAPARTRFGNAVQCLLVEPEFEIGELRRQRRRVIVEQLELEIHAPVGHRHGLDQLADALDERRLAHVETLHRRAHAFEERHPVEARRQLLVFGQRHRVVGLHRIAVLDLGPLIVGDARLERRNARGGRARIALAGARQHLFDVLGELRAELRVLLVGRKVVVAVGHGEPVLVERAEIDGRILAVGTREPGERLRNADALRVADVTRHVARRGDRVDARQFVFERRDPEAFHARGIHVGEIEVADLLRIRTRGPVRLRRGRDDELLHLFLRLIIENGERAVIGAIRRNLGVSRARRRLRSGTDRPADERCGRNL